MISLRRQGSWSRIAIATLGTSVLQLSLVGLAHAEEDSATETAAARTLAVDGLKLAQAGKCEEAIPKLERAEKLHHSAIVLSRLGECHVSEGKLVEGTEMLRKVGAAIRISRIGTAESARRFESAGLARLIRHG